METKTMQSSNIPTRANLAGGLSVATAVVVLAFVVSHPTPVLLAGTFDPQATFRVGGGSAAVGETISLPFTVNANAELQGFAVSVDLDEERLTVTSIEPAYERPDGLEWGFYAANFNNENAVPGNAGVADEGYLYAAAVVVMPLNDTDDYRQLPPPDTDNEMLRFHFRVGGNGPGTTTLAFEDGAPTPNGLTVENNATLRFQSAELDAIVEPVFINGRLEIVGDVILFVRGDTNGNGSIEMADAVTTLNYLFRGAEAPPCLDAADANDDGLVNIADPIGTLQAMFRNGAPLPPPYPLPGSDPTPDSILCD